MGIVSVFVCACVGAYIDICNICAPIHQCISVYGCIQYVYIIATLQYMACLETHVRASVCVCAPVFVGVSVCVSVDGVTGFPIKLNHRPDQC